MKTLLLDLDGTMYHGRNIIPSAKQLVDYLQLNQLPFYFFTNNASRTPTENADHMINIGYQNIIPSMFYNSSMACVAYLKKNFPGKQVMMVGQAGLQEELLRNGYSLVSENAEYVMVGMNKEGNYRLYSQALSNLINGAQLFGTNSDRILLSENGVNVGNGSVVAMLEYASGQKAVITGKPSPIILDEALEYFKLNKSEVMVVGDNLETDILCGINGGVKTALVLSGVHKQSDCERLNIVPDYIVDNLLDIIKIT